MSEWTSKDTECCTIDDSATVVVRLEDPLLAKSDYLVFRNLLLLCGKPIGQDLAHWMLWLLVLAASFFAFVMTLNSTDSSTPLAASSAIFLYLHMATIVVVSFGLLVQMSESFRRSYPRWHRIVGRSILALLFISLLAGAVLHIFQLVIALQINPRERRLDIWATGASYLLLFYISAIAYAGYREALEHHYDRHRLLMQKLSVVILGVLVFYRLVFYVFYYVIPAQHAALFMAFEIEREVIPRIAATITIMVYVATVEVVWMLHHGIYGRQVWGYALMVLGGLFAICLCTFFIFS
ncbi:hypothetical protein HDV03_004462 [Kappamyces sp. JEL0829]|nr:hypothetical protein HDV03_004462 [Kappamyces sp. JEL0829]